MGLPLKSSSNPLNGSDAIANTVEAINNITVKQKGLFVFILSAYNHSFPKNTIFPTINGHLTHVKYGINYYFWVKETIQSKYYIQQK